MFSITVKTRDDETSIYKEKDYSEALYLLGKAATLNKKGTTIILREDGRRRAITKIIVDFG